VDLKDVRSERVSPTNRLTALPQIDKKVKQTTEYSVSKLQKVISVNYYFFYDLV